jgi:hypothetical protein
MPENTLIGECRFQYRDETLQTPPGQDLRERGDA